MTPTATMNTREEEAAMAAIQEDLREIINNSDNSDNSASALAGETSVSNTIEAIKQIAHSSEEKERQMCELKKQITDYSEHFKHNSSESEKYIEHLLKYTKHTIKDKHKYLFSKSHNISFTLDIIKETLKSNPHLVGTLKLFEVNDEKVLRHAVGTMAVSLLVADSMGYARKNLKTIAKAAAWHDVSKVLPYINEVINMPRKLTPEEWDIVHEHTHASHKAVSAISDYETSEDFEMISESAHRHHVHYDRQKGYPPGLPFISDEELIKRVSLISLADAYDAMMADKSERPYKGEDELECGENIPHSHYDKVNNTLIEFDKCSGTQFDPHLVDKLKGLHSDFSLDKMVQSDKVYMPALSLSSQDKTYQGSNQQTISKLNVELNGTNNVNASNADAKEYIKTTIHAADNYNVAADQTKAVSAAPYFAMGVSRACSDISKNNSDNVSR